MRAAVLALAFALGLAAASAARADAEATNHPPALTGAEVDYNQVDLKDDLYVYKGQPLTGTAVSRYRKTGAVRGLYPYREGRLHGLVEEWYTNGVQSVSTRFDGGARHGRSAYWNPDGSLLKRQTWDHDKLTDSTHKEDLEPAP